MGPGAGQIAAHRVLCCSTLDGKISIARQLEPGLHIDGHPHTVCSQSWLAMYNRLSSHGPSSLLIIIFTEGVNVQSPQYVRSLRCWLRQILRMPCLL